MGVKNGGGDTSPNAFKLLSFLRHRQQSQTIKISPIFEPSKRIVKIHYSLLPF